MPTEAASAVSTPALPPIVVAITGASGAVYARRLLEVLAGGGQPIHLTISTAGAQVVAQELGRSLDLDRFAPADLWPDPSQNPAAASGTIRYFHHTDLMAPIASGSHPTRGMVICPCSGSTLSAVVTGAGNNLIHRAAEVHLKEGRRLILVPRETPLSFFFLENMRRAALAGAVVLPAMPGWYHGVRTIDDLVDFVVARILDQLGIPHQLIRPWGAST